MSGLHLVKQGRDRRRIDLQRDFTVASPAEFVTRFGGNKVIEKVMIFLFSTTSLMMKNKPVKNSKTEQIVRLHHTAPRKCNYYLWQDKISQYLVKYFNLCVQINIDN